MATTAIGSERREQNRNATAEFEFNMERVDALILAGWIDGFACFLSMSHTQQDEIDALVYRHVHPQHTNDSTSIQKSLICDPVHALLAR
ncbi:unnamed protein product [Toxocara canis]|uniref:Uncharacterized protein n=1 Tax=Toxocara canis TaxID=6265 RepID=A0A183UT79_TOXCA|nr:unnamed protein product [Toxocara canis]